MRVSSVGVVGWQRIPWQSFVLFRTTRYCAWWYKRKVMSTIPVLQMYTTRTIRTTVTVTTTRHQLGSTRTTTTLNPCRSCPWSNLPSPSNFSPPLRKRCFSTNLVPPQQPHYPDPQQQQQPFPGDTCTFYSTLFFRGLLAVGMVYCVTEYVAELTLLEGPSMYPTMSPYGEIVLIDKYTLNRIHGQRRRKRRGRRQAQSRSGHESNLGDEADDDDPYIISKGQERLQRALKRQEAFEATMKDIDESRCDEWHEPRVSISDLPPPTWSTLWQHLTTPLSIGDVVVLQHPNRKGTICKRVLGLPGDAVVRPGRASSNRYRPGGLNGRGLLVIPDGHIWVEGDNPANSSDSRTYGAVPMALLRGRVLVRVWPLKGNALILRGAPPRQPNGLMGYTVLPAGYEGQRIAKTPTPTQNTDKSTNRK